MHRYNSVLLKQAVDAGFLAKHLNHEGIENEKFQP
jgi:hypothetical protein